MDFQKCQEILKDRATSKAKEGDNSCEHMEAAVRDLSITADPTSLDNELLDLSKSSSANLISALFHAQEQRVQAYAKFEKIPASSMGSDSFQRLTKQLTDEFSAISTKIKEVEKLLLERSETVSIGSMIRKLQLEEKEKLILTCALMLDKMRLHSVKGELEGEFEGERRDTGLDHSTKLLEESYASTIKKRQGIIANVNEVLEEIRYEATDIIMQDET